MRKIALFLLSLCYVHAAHAVGVTEQVGMDFGRLIVPGGGGVIEIDPDNTLASGGSLYVTPPTPNRGQYRFTGSGGDSFIDISITNVSSCAGTTLVDFDAEYEGTPYNDIVTNPIIGQAYNPNDTLYIGARLTYADSVAIGVCAASFDLNVTTY